MINLDHEIPVEIDKTDQDSDLSFETDIDSFKEVHKTGLKVKKIL